MLKAAYRIVKYFAYRLKAGNAHGLHSPFVFSFYQDLWSDKTPFYAFHIIERERNRMLGDETPIPQIDYGAGSSVSSKTQRTVGDITRVASSPPWKAQLLFKLVNYYSCQTMVELGTCLGLTTSYLASVNSSNQVYSFEGNPHQIKTAHELFGRLRLKNITLIEGDMHETLKPTLDSIAEKIDFAYLDGNHRYQPTLDYYNLLLPKMSAQGILIFDDIYWSPEMGKAWKEISRDERIPVTVDLYHLGIAFLGVKCPKQHFVLR